jgi:hypothetical protein
MFNIDLQDSAGQPAGCGNSTDYRTNFSLITTLEQLQSIKGGKITDLQSTFFVFPECSNTDLQQR